MMKKSFILLSLSAAVVSAAVLLSAAPPSAKPATKAAGSPASAVRSIVAEAKPDSSQEAARLNNLGVAYMNQQAFEKGLKQFRDAAAADPSLAVARLNAAVALLNLQKLEEARPMLVALSQSTPKDAHVWYNLALLLKNSGELDGAVDAFHKVLEIDSRDADAYYFLGSVESQRKHQPEAIAAFQHALELNPLHVSAQFGLSRAYQQTGNPAEARKHLERFQQITRDKLGAAITLAYGEQGQYSKVEESPQAVAKAPAAISVKFVKVANSGLSLGATRQDFSEHSRRDGPPDWGACLLDFDSDGRVDVFTVDGNESRTPDGKIHRGSSGLYQNQGAHFRDVTTEAGLIGIPQWSGCAVGDFDNDGMPDLAMAGMGRVLLFHHNQTGGFLEMAETAGIHYAGFASGLTFVDYDHDGDLDLFVTGPKGNVVFRNNGNSTFTEVTSNLGLAGDGVTRQMIATDFNNDRAVDMVVTGDKTQIYVNPREGKWSAVQPWSSPMPAPTMGVSALDFDHDGWMDLAFTHDGAPGLTLWRNVEGRSYEPVKLPDIGWVRAKALAAVDYDSDGWMDLVAAGVSKSGKEEIRLLRNLGPDGFKDVTAEVGLDKVAISLATSITVADFDNDGDQDLLVTQRDGEPILLRNDGGNKNHWLKLAFKGLNDNHSGFGAKVEVFAGGMKQKFELAGSSGYLAQSSPVLTVGLGSAPKADIVRMLWPTGVLQDELEAKPEALTEFIEIDRRGSSCPTLFAWDGTHFALVGDLLGAGVLGHWVAPNERNIPRPAEYIKLEPGQAKMEDGKLRFRLMEPMEEVVYLDQVKLVAVDHPAGVDVLPDERFVANPPFPVFGVVRYRNPQLPAGLWDDHGSDLLPMLRARKYIEGFELLPFKGFTKMHSLEMDLGQKYDGGALRLLLHGEIEYFTATGMYAADQAGVKATSPFVEAQDASGKWTRVVEDMGFPAGLARTMVADLTGKLPIGTQRIRISTNLQIYWDSILVDRTAQDSVAIQTTDVVPSLAQLDFHGYPRQVEGKPAGNVQYRYEEISHTGPYARQPGTYTRYGDVLPLLTAADDRFTVFGSGEEVALEFDVNHLAPPAAGMVRDYFFMAHGYEKDMDFYAAEGSTVEPLPFNAMPGYPYAGKQFPLDQEHLDYLLEFNTRQVSGNEPRGYWYQFNPEPSGKRAGKAAGHALQEERQQR